MASPFIRDPKLPVSKGQEFIPIEKNTIKEYIVKQVVKKTGDGEEDFVIVNKVILDKEYNRNEYINSHNDEVGLKNILKKVQMTGDVTLLNQRGGALNNGDEIYDFTSLPDNPIEAYNVVKAGVDLYDQLPNEMKKDMSMTEFVEKFDAESYVQSIMAKQQVETKKGENE